MNNQNQSAKQMFLIMLLSMGLSFFLMSQFQNRMGNDQKPQAQPLSWDADKAKIESLAREALDLTGIDDEASAIKEIQRLSKLLEEHPQGETAAAYLLRVGVVCQKFINHPKEIRDLLENKIVPIRAFGNADAPTSQYPVTAVYSHFASEYAQSVFLPTVAVYKMLALPANKRAIGTAPFKEFEGYTTSIRDRRESARDTVRVPVFVRENRRVEIKEFLEVAGEILEPEYRKGWRYRMMEFLVKSLKRIPGAAQKSSPISAYGLAIILFAVLIRLALWPLTTAQFRSMRDMQKKMVPFQAEVKKLQEKHKDKGNREQQMQMYQEMRALQRKHGVNPFVNVGCLLMVIQMPILFTLYYVIQHYQFQFQNAHFLWIHSLAQPDLILLALYVLSMIVQSKVMSAASPVTDPEQAQMQKMMMYLTPVMFAFFFKGFPAALILYWFTFNVMYTVHQYLIMREGQSGGDRGLKSVIKTLNPLTPSSNGSGAPILAGDDKDGVPPRPEKEEAESTPSARKAKRKRRRR
jgi:YidC/Oxa1 family membrane protein insertase